MAVGFTQYAERTYAIKVKASYFDFIWDDERIQEAEERLNRAFIKFEKLIIASTERPIDSIDSIEIVGVHWGQSRTV